MAESCFFTGGPCPEEYFFGRTEETGKVLGLLRRNQNVSVVGKRRIGKSSFLLHISNPVVSKTYDLVKHRFVYMCCRDLADLASAESRAKIVQRAEQRIPEVTSSLPLGGASSAVNFERCRRFFRDVEKAGLRCVVMLDHFESLTENPQIDYDFLGGLRAMNAMHQVLYVVASTEPLVELEDRWLNDWDQTSPFFNIFYKFDLTPFIEDESRAFLRQGFDRASLSVPESAVDLIVSQAQDHPFYLQSAGDYVVRLLDDAQSGWSDRLTKRLQEHLTDLTASDISQSR
jgi:AAA+ ATPase superfamily predicted ATPase